MMPAHLARSTRKMLYPCQVVLFFGAALQQVAVTRGMRTKTLGSGSYLLEGVSECMLGTMTWGEQNSEAEAFAQLDLALAMGVNFIDTAELYPVPPNGESYGETERIIGRWLAADPRRRAQLVLATKVAGDGRDYIPTARRRDLPEGYTVAAAWGPPDPSSASSSSSLSSSSSPPDPPARKSGLWREQILEALDSSLARLQTDYVDLFQLHWPARYTPIFSAKRYQRRHERRPEDIPAVDEQVLAIKECLDSGKVKAWGLSNENAVGVSLFLESCRRLGVPPPATIQNDFSAAHRRFEEDGTAEACAPLHSAAGKEGVALLAYGALAGGTLTGKVRALPTSSEAKGNEKGKGKGKEGEVIVAPEQSRHVLFPHFQPRYYSAGTLAAAADYAAIAGELGLTPAQLALVWARQREYMGAVIIGATTLAQLKENIEAFDLPDLSPAVLRRIDAVDERLAAAYYRGVQPGAVRGEDTGSVEMEVEVEVEAQGGEPEKEPRMVER